MTAINILLIDTINFLVQVISICNKINDLPIKVGNVQNFLPASVIVPVMVLLLVG